MADPYLDLYEALGQTPTSNDELESQLNPSTYTPPSLNDPQMLGRSVRGESGVTMRVGFGESSRQVPIEDTLFPNLPMPFRSVMVGASRAGMAVASPINRLFGRGDLVDEKRRQVEAFSRYNRGLSKNSVLGETVGAVVNDVSESLTMGTLAAPAGGLAATSMAFGLDGMDRTYVETKDAGHAEDVAVNAAARQFLIDGAITFAGGKLVQAKGLNPGRAFGDPVGKAARKAAESAGLRRIIASSIADGGIEGLQGGLTYANQVFTGTAEFDWGDLAMNIGMSAAVGGLAGAVTSGVEQLSLATERFNQKTNKLINTVKQANEFHARADTDAKAKAVAAKTNKEFVEATGMKGLGADERVAFQEEIMGLEQMRSELEQNGVDPGRSIADDETSVAAMEAQLQRQMTEMIQAERAINDPELSPAEQAKRRTALDVIQERVKQEQSDLKVVRERLERRRKAAEGELHENRAFLDSELNRITAEHQRDRPVGRPSEERLQREQRESRVPEGTEPVVDSRAKAGDEIGTGTQDLQAVRNQLLEGMELLSSQFDQRFADIETSRDAVSDLAGRIEAGETMPLDFRRDLAKLVDQFGSTREKRADIFGELARADSPESFGQAVRKIITEIDNAELETARLDLQDAIKKSKNVRPEQADEIASIAEWVNRASVADIRAAADEVRSLIYQSDIADRFLTFNTDRRISEVAGRVVAEVAEARPLAMKADDPIRRAIQKFTGKVPPGLDISRDWVSLDSPFLREMAMRPEVQLNRLGPSISENVYQRIGVQAQSDFDLFTRETVEGLSNVFREVGLDHAPTMDSSLKSHPLEAWRNTQRKFNNVDMTRDEVQGIMLLARDPENLAVLKKHGFQFPDGRSTGPITDKLRNQFRDFLGGEGQRITDWQFQYLNGPNIDRVNDAMKLITGRPVTHRRNTVPRTVDKDWNISGMSPLEGLQRTALTNYQHLRRREGTSQPLTWPDGTTGGIEYFMNHVDRMNRIAAFAAPARDAEMVLNRKDVRDAILAKEGKEGLDNIQESIRVTVNGAKKSSMSDAAIRRWNGATTLSVIGARLSTILTQPMSTIVSAAYDTKGLRQYLRNAPTAAFSKENLNLMEQVLGENSGHFWRRYVNQDYLGQQTGGVVRSRGWFRAPALGGHFARPLATVERSANSAWRFAKARHDAAAEGLIEGTREWQKAVTRKWELATYRGENSSNGMELAGLLRMGKDNPAFGTLVTLQNTASKIYSLLPRAFDLADQGQYKDAIGVLAVAAAATLPVSLLRAAMRERDDDVSFVEAVQDQLIQDLASQHPLGGLVLVPVVRGMQNEPQFDNMPLLIETVQNLTVAVGELAGGIIDSGDASDDPEGFFNQLWDVVVPLVSLRGIPVRSVEDYAKRLGNGTLFPGLDEGTDYTSSELIDMFSAFNPGQGENIKPPDKTLTVTGE